MYLDLNVPYPATKAQAKQIALMAIQLGYDGIVWTRTVTSKLTPKDVNNMEYVDVSDAWRAHGSQQSLLRVKQPDYHLPAAASDAVAASAATPAAAASSSSASTASSSTPPSSFLQKSRIHFILEDLTLLHSLNPSNTVLHSYDLVSVSTSNEKVFHACCSHESVDIISLDSRGKQPFYLKKPMMNLALERGIHFEFQYGHAVRDPAARRYLVANIMGFLRLTRGRNIVFGSAAAKEMEIRAPWDVINLAVLCGVDAAIAKASISANVRAVLLHAEARKTIKCVLREIKTAPSQPAAAAAAHAAAASAASSDASGRSKPGVADADQQKGKKAKFK